MELIILVIGILIGLLIERYIFQEKPIGSLRIDQSDPDSGPYLFLELDPAEQMRFIRSSVFHCEWKLRIIFRTNSTSYYENQ